MPLLDGSNARLLSLQRCYQTLVSLGIVGFVEGTYIIFLSTDVGIYTLKINSGQMTKVGKRAPYYAVIPYTSFYFP